MIVSPFLSPSFQNSYLSLVFFPLPVLVVLVPTPTPLLPIPPLATSGGVSHPYPYNSCNVVTLARCSYSCSHLVLTLFSPLPPLPLYPYIPLYITTSGGVPSGVACGGPGGRGGATRLWQWRGGQPGRGGKEVASDMTRTHEHNCLIYYYHITTPVLFINTTLPHFHTSTLPHPLDLSQTRSFDKHTLLIMTPLLIYTNSPSFVNVLLNKYALLSSFLFIPSSPPPLPLLPLSSRRTLWGLTTTLYPLTC